MEAKTAEGEWKMKKLLAVCLMALVCWVCAGYAEETRVGDTVIFGQYEQDGNLDNGSEPIAWLVLDVQGGKALLMSRYALDCLPFHDEKTDAAWNQSALNAWLQADFHAAFTDAEWAAIAPVTLADMAADGNPEWQNTDAEPAETHVFLLSYAQLMQYLPEQEQRKVSGTEYARSRGAEVSGIYHHRHRRNGLVAALAGQGKLRRVLSGCPRRGRNEVRDGETGGSPGAVDELVRRPQCVPV